MSNNQRMLTIKQASNIIEGITEYRIRQMCINGELPCFKAGKKYLINEKTLRNIFMCQDEVMINE